MANRTMNCTEFSSLFNSSKPENHGVRLPGIEAPKDLLPKFKSYPSNNYEILVELCREGFKNLKLHKLQDNEKYVKRIKYELDVLNELGFIDYILLVWEVIAFCKKNDIPTGLGRGSAAGSLVLYVLGCTGIDPVKYELYFERFVSKIRAKKKVVDGITYLDGSLMCDVDIDVCYYNRQRVLQYLDEKFSGKTSKILTFNTLSGKLLIKECGKVIEGLSEDQVNEASKLIPKTFGQVMDIEEAYSQEDDFRNWCDEHKKVYDISLKLRNLIKNKGVHPSAIAISHDKLDEVCPTELTSDKNIVSSYDMNSVSAFSVKLDILGLRGVSVVDQTCKLLGITINDIDLNHESIYRNLQDLKAQHGLFQIEADLAYKVVREVKPKCLEELSAVLALARPGAMAYIDQYSKYSNHGDYEAVHPFFDDILKSTGGVCLYQEQLMKMVSKIGFSLDDSEQVRRCVGKKKVEEMKLWEGKIKDKIKENNLDPKIGEVLWKVANDSANYQFNKSHSLAYAALAACTVYLKFNHPKEFYLSLLRMSKYEPDPINEVSKIQKELRIFNIELLRPHLNKSSIDFEIEGDNIRFGLLSIKGVSDKTIEKITQFRKNDSNKFETFQSAKEAGVNIGILCSLIQAGALDGFKNSRSFIVYEAQLWNQLTDKEKSLCMDIAEEYDFQLVRILQAIQSKTNEKGKPLIKESRISTIRTKSEPYKKIYEQNKKSESFANWYYENHLLGYTCGTKLKEIFDKLTPNLEYIYDIVESANEIRTKVIGTVCEKPRTGTSRKGSKYLKFQIKDETGIINVMIFNDNYDTWKEYNGGKNPQEDDIIIVKGVKKDRDTIFAESFHVQSNKVYTKLSELKDKNS